MQNELLQFELDSSETVVFCNYILDAFVLDKAVRWRNRRQTNQFSTAEFVSAWNLI